MKPYRALVFAAALAIASAATAAPPEETALAERFSQLVKEHFPQAEIVLADGQFTAKHGTMTFTVHGHRVKYRGYHKQPYKIEGPDFEGFMLSLAVRPGPYETQATTIREGYLRTTLREPYWQTFIARLPTPDGKGHYVIDFSYGSGLDDDFKNRILAALPKDEPPRVDGRAVAPPEEMTLADRLGQLVREHHPKAEIVQANGKFTAKYGTMIFTLHGRSKRGEFAEKPHQEEGPNFRGFILTLAMADGQYMGAAVAPQTLDHGYWQTYITRPPTDDGAGHYVINFSYGPSLDKDFKQRIFAALPKYAGLRSNTPENVAR